MSERQQNTYLEQRVQAPEHYIPDAYENTLDGYVGLLSELRETQRALSQDFRVTMAGNRERLEELAAPHIEKINAARTAVDAEPTPISSASDHFLLGLAEPAWKNHMPKDPDDKESVAAWEDFKMQFDDSLGDNLEVLYELHSKVDALQDNELLQREFREQFRDQHSEHVKIVIAATAWRKQEQRKISLSEDIAAIRQRASQSGRSLTSREQKKIQDLGVKLEQMQDISLDPSLNRDAFIAELDRLDRRDSKKELESGLLMTKQMESIIKEALPALLRGEPALLVGETGGAKTALAEYIANKYLGAPELISGYGDINSYQLMGKPSLRAENGATTSEFIPGPIVRAMEAGRPVILDEINAIPPEQLKRLNKIMQLRPGDKLTIQEDSGRQVTVQPGFCIIGTANEKSRRYKGVDDLSVEGQNRFGANIYRVRYPDANNAYGDAAIENDRLAVASVVDVRGAFPSSINTQDFDHFVKACFISQQLFTGNHGEGFDKLLSTDRKLDNKPGLEETVLAPRTMVAILKKVAGSHGEMSIKQACTRFLDGIKNAEDKKVLQRIFADRNLISTGA